MFSSTQTLPPRTKRWAEAKVLADCVAVRVSCHESKVVEWTLLIDRSAGCCCTKARRLGSPRRFSCTSSASATCLEGGASEKRLLNTGRGSHDSIVSLRNSSKRLNPRVSSSLRSHFRHSPSRVHLRVPLLPSIGPHPPRRSIRSTCCSSPHFTSTPLQCALYSAKSALRKLSRRSRTHWGQKLERLRDTYRPHRALPTRRRLIMRVWWSRCVTSRLECSS